MKTTVKFTRRFYRGNLQGLTHESEIPFVNRQLAQSWIDGIKANVKSLDYTIENEEIKNNE